MTGLRKKRTLPHEAKDGVSLSPRQQQILILIGQGKTSKEIAAALGISFKTVDTHRAHIQSKTRANNTADLTRAAIRMGLIEP